MPLRVSCLASGALSVNSTRVCENIGIHEFGVAVNFRLAPSRMRVVEKVVGRKPFASLIRAGSSRHLVVRLTREFRLRQSQPIMRRNDLLARLVNIHAILRSNIALLRFHNGHICSNLQRSSAHHRRLVSSSHVNELRVAAEHRVLRGKIN
jgi:hypothetical protein